MADMFRSAFAEEDVKIKSYEELLEEYEQFFNTSGSSRERQDDMKQYRGSHLVMEHNLTFEQAMTGVTQKLKINRMVQCSTCKGKKVKSLDEQMVCEACSGVGADQNIIGEPCKQCSGTGLKSIKCNPCSGKGMVSQQVDLQVKIPRSVDDGMLLRIKKKGNEALNGVPGDLILTVKVQPHPVFERRGFDIHSTQNISVTKAILGGEIEVQTLSGPRRVTVQPGTEHNSVHKLEFGGFENILENYKAEKRGHHFVTFKIVIPKKVSSEQKEALQQLAQAEAR